MRAYGRETEFCHTLKGERRPIRVVGREFWAPWRGVRGPKSAPVEGGNAALISD
jgi:hypothetical protein